MSDQPGVAVEKAASADVATTAADREFNAMKRQASVLASSGMLAPHFTRKPEAVMAVMLTLQQVGAPVTIPNINMFDDVKGRIQPRVQFLIALAAARGVEIWMPDDECSATSAVAYGQRMGSLREHKYTFTWDDAVKAGLTGSDTYKKHAEVMLKWRAAGRLLRTHFPDVALGFGQGFLEGNVAVPSVLDDGPLVDEIVPPAGVDADTGEVAAAPADPDDEITDAEIVDEGESSEPHPQEESSSPSPACPAAECTVDGDHTHDPYVARQAVIPADEMDKPAIINELVERGCETHGNMAVLRARLVAARMKP